MLPIVFIPICTIRFYLFPLFSLFLIKYISWNFSMCSICFNGQNQFSFFLFISTSFLTLFLSKLHFFALNIYVIMQHSDTPHSHIPHNNVCALKKSADFVWCEPTIAVPMLMIIWFMVWNQNTNIWCICICRANMHGLAMELNPETM